MPIELDPIPSSARPVTWSEAKTHLRLSDDTQQAYVESLIDAATDYAEEAMACTLVQRERTHTQYDGARTFPLPYGPVVSVTSVVDDDDVAVSYERFAVGNSERITLTTSFAAPVTVTYQAGHATAAAISAQIRHNILMHVATLFENRETIVKGQSVPIPQSLQAFYALKSRKVPVA